MLKKVCTVLWKHHGDGRVTLTFINNITHVCLIKTFKTKAAAKGAETRFNKTMTRMYGGKLV